MFFDAFLDIAKYSADNARIIAQELTATVMTDVEV